METITDRILGNIVIYKDYIRKLTNDQDEIIFKQSNTKLPGYADRNIGVCLFNKKIMVAIALNYNTKKDNDKTVKSVIRQRLHTILKNSFDINPEDDGFTYVPIEYSNLLWKDFWTFRNLHGMLDPTYSQMAINSLNGRA